MSAANGVELADGDFNLDLITIKNLIKPLHFFSNEIPAVNLQKPMIFLFSSND